MVFYTNSDSGYVLDVSLTGTPDGTETLTILPTSTSIYDFVGNAASTSQSNSTVTLNDQRITMAITAVNGSSSAVSDGSTTNDATLTVTFTSSAATTNFAVGDITVSGGSLSSFSGSGTTYTATFTPTAVGVNVAVYVVPLPLNELRLPPLTVISPTAKLVVAALLVNVTVNVASFVVEPSLTAELLPLTAVMAMVIL